MTIPISNVPITNNVIVQESLWQIQGAMGFAEVKRLLSMTLPHLKPLNTRLVIDLSQVSEVDSASVSLLMEWQRQAKIHMREITFQHLPANLTALAEVYGVEALIPVEP